MNDQYHNYVINNIRMKYIIIVNILYVCMQINNNGDLSFNSEFEDYTPDSFPISTALIAPFWTDLVRYSDSNVWHRLTTNTETIKRVSEDVASAFPQLTTFSAIEVLIVTWDNVGYVCSSEEVSIN